MIPGTCAEPFDNGEPGRFNVHIMRSIFLTGASGVGKSTIYRELIQSGLQPSPNHITRPRRPDEIDGIDACFVTPQAFALNFFKGAYLESSLQETEYIGVHYGSPREWEDLAGNESAPIVAIPANVVVFGGLCQRLAARGQREQVCWVNLTAPLETRRERIAPRISDLEVLNRRLFSGVSQGEQSAADLNLDTSGMGVAQSVDTILAYASAPLDNRLALSK